MGIEGRGRLEGSARRSLEDPFRMGIEVRGNHFSEDAAERENYWLGDLGITPEVIDDLRQSQLYEGSSTEYLVYMLLLGKLVEGGPEWNPSVRNRVRNLVGALRIVGFESMNEHEQASLVELSQSTSFNMRDLRFDVSADIISDIRWIWGTFGLRVPQSPKVLEVLNNWPTH